MNAQDEQIGTYLGELDGPNVESAWHSLAEVGPAAIPAVIRALDAPHSPSVRTALIRLLAEYRAEDAVHALATQLQDPLPAVWQAAVDALVTIGSEKASAVLASARSGAAGRQRTWLDEAVTQIDANRS